jgi:hypothetical protein
MDCIRLLRTLLLVVQVSVALWFTSNLAVAVDTVLTYRPMPDIT